MNRDVEVRQAIYRHFVHWARRPPVDTIARAVGLPEAEVRDAYARLYQSRVLVLEPDGESIRMAPPFSGVPTQHRVRIGKSDYFANCAWDALGIPAAVRRPGRVNSRCEQSGESLVMEVTLDAPPVSDWLFHCAVPAALWWKDIVFT